jgi:hypothetical protein
MLRDVDVQDASSAWIIQQLREAFPFEAPRKFLMFDRDL